MGITPYELIAMQRAGKPRTGNLLDAPRPHTVRGGDEVKLQREAMQYTVLHNRRTQEQEREHVMDLIDEAKANQTDEADFDAFHQMQVTVRDFSKFRKLHPEYLDTAQNRSQLIGLLQSQGLNNADLAQYEEAFVALAASGKLELDLTKAKDRTELDDLNAVQLLEKIEQATKQSAREERADRELFNNKTSGAPAAQRFVREHPEYIVCPANAAALESMLKTQGVNPEFPTFKQLNEAFDELVERGELQLDESKKPAKAEPVDPYSLSMAELERRAGGRDTAVADDYVPSGSRFGAMGFTFEPGEER